MDYSFEDSRLTGIPVGDPLVVETGVVEWYADSFIKQETTFRGNSALRKLVE